MKKTNLLYFIICSLIILVIIYGGFLYNIYIHPTKILSSTGEDKIILFGDFKYLFKVINCHNLGFNVYSLNDCYKDYYGSFLYGPSILLFPSITKDISEVLTNFFLAPLLILTFIYLNIKLIKPNNIFKYILTTLILFNPTTLFLYEKLNIDILVYIFLILLVYHSKHYLLKLTIIFILTITKFYPAILSIIFLIQKNNKIKNIVYFFSSLIFISFFIFIFWENLISVLGTLEYVSQSFRYSFSLNSLNKIFIYVINLDNTNITKLALIIICFLVSYITYYFLLKSKYFFIEKKLNNDSTMFILSSSLSVSLYLIFGNNFYREIYLIGIIPFILNNYDIKFFRYILFLFVFKYLYLLVFFPYYYNADLNLNFAAQVFIGLKTSLDFLFICTIISALFLFIKIYLIKYINYFKKK